MLFKKLPPLNNANPFNRLPIINNNQFNRPIITPINNNMNEIEQMKKMASNNPRVKVQMIDKEGNTIQSNRNTHYSSKGMPPAQNTDIISQNAANNPKNNLRPNAAYIPRLNQLQSQQNQMIINRNYILQNQTYLPLLTFDKKYII